MALIERDPLKDKARNLVQFLKTGKPLPRSYDIIEKDEMIQLLLIHIDELNEVKSTYLNRIKEYQDIFTAMGKFIKR